MALPAPFSFWVFVSGETEDGPFKPVQNSDNIIYSVMNKHQLSHSPTYVKMGRRESNHRHALLYIIKHRERK